MSIIKTVSSDGRPSWPSSACRLNNGQPKPSMRKIRETRLTFLSLAKASGIDPFHRNIRIAPIDLQMGKRIIRSFCKSIGKLNSTSDLLWSNLPSCDGSFWQAIKQSLEKIIAQLDSQFPAESFEMNWLLCETLVLSGGSIRSHKGMALLKVAHPRGANGIRPVSS